MTENLILDREQLFIEVVETGRAQGVAEQEAYHELVDTIVQEKLQVGELDEDQNTVGIIQHLKDRWADYQAELGI